VAISSHLLDGEDFDLVIPDSGDVPDSFAKQCVRDRLHIGDRSVARIGFIFADDREDLSPAVAPFERYAVSESDHFGRGRRRKDLSAAQAFGQIALSPDRRSRPRACRCTDRFARRSLGLSSLYPGSRQSPTILNSRTAMPISRTMILVTSHLEIVRGLSPIATTSDFGAASAAAII
jgi:hypothetical protein